MHSLRIQHALLALAMVISLSPQGWSQDPFPTATPEEVGLSGEALVLLGEHVADLIKNDEAVGAELHVIKSGRTVFHEAFGWADRQEQQPMRVNSIHCVRSMTKPLVGTAVQMLIDEGKLTLDQPVSGILDSYDRPATEHITLEQLLTHTSGLPFSTIRKPLSEYASIMDVAGEAAQAKLSFKPGTDFQYSDAGSDTLGAIVWKITGVPPEKFIEQRILRPLAMADSFTKLPSDDLLLERIPSAYSGGSGSWERHWHPEDEPIFPFFLTSQSLYATTRDYARFIKLWMDEGSFGGEQLLSSEAIQRGLQLGRRVEEYPVGFRDLELTYGQQWMVYKDKDSRRRIFGHNGSDGTHVWAWPDDDLIVLFFTQTRGTLAGIELEPTLDQLLIQRDVDGYRTQLLATQEARAKYGRYEGLYWDQDKETACYAIRLLGNQLMMERPGRLRAVAKPQSEEGKFLVAGGLGLKFEDGDPAPAVRMTAGSNTERQVRHVTEPNLPSVEELNTQVRQAYGMQRLSDAGVIKLSGTIKMGPLGLSSKFVQWFDSRNMRTEIKSWTSSSVIIVRGAQVAVSSNGGKSYELQSGVTREQEILSHPAVHYGDWNADQTRMQVLRRVQMEDHDVILVRAEINDLPGSTILIDGDSGLVVAEHSLQYAPGAGYIGVETTYDDFRELAGMKLPFRTDSKFANPLIGSVIIQFDSFEVGLDSDQLFEIPDE